MRTHALAATILAVTTVPAVARAYDQHWTHPWLTRMAAEHLAAAYPGEYDELLEHVDDVAFGSREEDDFLIDGDDDPTTLRVMRHFYRPTDGLGLTYGGRLFPSSYEWSAVPNDTNDWDWGDGMRQYRRGETQAAYVTLGHVVHLIQDATVPAHTHLDQHGPPSGDDYESYVTSRFSSADSTTLPLPAPGTAIPAFADAYEAWQATAWRSYEANLFSGDLEYQDSPAGELASMFPDLHWDWFSENWEISSPPVGSLGDGFLEEEPGFFYVENAEHAPAGGAPLVEQFAAELVPVAILHTAAVMKLYIDEARAQAPELPEEPEQPAPPMSAGCAVAGGPSGAFPFALFLVLFVVAVFVSRRTN